MQIFLPFSDFADVAKILDSKRLCKQIVEAWQIYTGRTPNPNHPACLEWGQKKSELKFYILEMCREYTRRYNKVHSIEQKILSDNNEISTKKNEVHINIRISHCVNLIRKGVSVDILKSELKNLIGEFQISEFPEGYWWQIYKSKGNAEKHTAAWNEWFRKHIFSRSDVSYSNLLKDA